LGYWNDGNGIRCKFIVARPTAQFGRPIDDVGTAAQKAAGLAAAELDGEKNHDPEQGKSIEEPFSFAPHSVHWV
jgi:hypothetical protein